MTERPGYKVEPYESPAKLPPSLLRGGAANGAAEAASPPSPPPLIHGIEEQPKSTDATTTIINAGNALFRVITARIAFHDAEAKKLRAVLRQFAQAAGVETQNVPTSEVSDDDIQFLRAALGKMTGDANV